MFQKHPYGVTVTNKKLNARQQPQEHILHNVIYGQVKTTLIYAIRIQDTSDWKEDSDWKT